MTHQFLQETGAAERPQTGAFAAADAQPQPIYPTATAAGHPLGRFGTPRPVLRGERLNDREPALTVILEGLAAVTDPDTGLCLHLAGPGETLGGEDTDHSRPVSGFWMTDGRVLEVMAETLSIALPAEDRLKAVIAGIQASRAAVEAEFVCSIRHAATPRLARWMLRLFDADPGGAVMISQANLGVMTGLQRTSVCAAMARLQAAGGLKVVRGRVLLRDRSALASLACNCGQLA